jgi:serine/threonine-protein kinase
VSDPLERLRSAFGKRGSSTGQPARNDGEMDALDRLRTTLADRYAIEHEIGSGGMATVYRAEDLKHHRPVAIKALRPDLSATLGPKRFLNEIRVAARLNHPHILGLHDSGDAGGSLYYVMPLVEGESLRAKIDREKQLSIDEAIALIRQAASALHYAHEQGVIHRDIKPENILIHRGLAVVADFGIALAVTAAAGGERLTDPGLSLGTPAYMSPEQVTGDREVDGRSDIYSLACVLYEMLAGDPPFLASNARAVLLKHVTDSAPSITTVRPHVAPPVAAAIAKALGKHPEDRFDSAKVFGEALSADLTEAEPAATSIVVLPFENLSPDPDNAFFADGLTEELIAELSGVRQLRVISRTSAMQFRGTTKSVPTIAGELNVRYVLEGSVRRAGGSVRITAQLIDASTDSPLWAERYSGTLDDIFDLQERLSRRITEALRVALTPDEARRIACCRFDDFRAFDALLRARQELMTLTPEGIERAIHFVRRAQEIVGENALVHATLARCYSLSYEFGISHDRETLQRADAHASMALDLAPDLGLALFAKAHVRHKQGEYLEVVRLLRRARETDRNTDALTLLAHVLAQVGRVAEAREVAAEALLLDPLDLFTRAIRGVIDLLDGQFDAAASRFREILDDPSTRTPHLEWMLAQAMAHAGRLEEARALFGRVAATDAAPVADLSALYLQAADGQRDAVAALLVEKPVVVETARTDESFPIFIANCLAMVGDERGALEWIDQAIAWGFCNDRYLAEHSPFLRPLRGSPGFEQLIGKARQMRETLDG